MSSKHEPLRKTERQELAAYVGFAPHLFLRARHWTAGRALREKIRNDLERGQTAVHTVHAMEAIVVEGRENEGPIVFVQTELMGVIRFAGRYLAREVGRGFPWPQIVIREAPESRVFSGVSGREGDAIPVAKRGPPADGGGGARNLR